jgi:hypothetical protein
MPAAAGQRAEDEANEKFSLLFTGPPQMPLEQGIHRFLHPTIGIFDLFIVPVDPEFVGCHYEAIFNRSTAHPTFPNLK